MLLMSFRHLLFIFFFFNDTATTEIYTLSLHDALPICFPPRRAPSARRSARGQARPSSRGSSPPGWCAAADRKSTRLNSSHLVISYAVFCLKKKKKSQTKLCILTHMYEQLCSTEITQYC